MREAKPAEQIATLRAASQRDEKQKVLGVPTSTVLGALGSRNNDKLSRSQLKLKLAREREERNFAKQMTERQITNDKQIKAYMKRQHHKSVEVQKKINANLRTVKGQESKNLQSRKSQKLKSKFDDLAIDRARESKFDLFSSGYESTMMTIPEEEGIDAPVSLAATDDGTGASVQSGSDVVRHFYQPDSPDDDKLGKKDVYNPYDIEWEEYQPGTIPWLIYELSGEQLEYYRDRWKSGEFGVQRVAGYLVEDMVCSTDSVAMHLEKFCVLLITLRGCCSVIDGRRKYNISGCVAAIWLWMRTYSPAISLTHWTTTESSRSAMEYIARVAIMSERLFCAGIDMVFTMFGYATFEATADYKSVLHSPLVNDCATLFAEIGATGIMAGMGLWSPEFNKWFHEFFVYKAKSGANIITTTMDIVAQLVEGGQLFWKSGDFMDFFCANNLREVQSEIAAHRADGFFVVQDGDSIDNVSGLYERINKTMEKITRVSLHYGPVHRYSPAISKMRDELTKILNDVRTLMKRGTIRTSPVVFELYGSPGTGKSILLYELLYYVLRMTGVPNPSFNMVSHINEADKFDSTIHNGTKAIVLDDIGAIRQDVLDGPPMITKLINFVNPVPTPSNQAELANKGAIYPMPHVIGITTNIKDMRIMEAMNVPEATARRCPIVISLIIPKNLCIDNTTKIDVRKLDSSKSIHHQILYLVEVRTMCSETQRLVPTKRHYVTGSALNSTKTMIPVDEIDDGFGIKAVSFTSMMLIFSDLATETWRRSVAYKSHIDSVMKSAACSVCHLPVTMDKCACDFYDVPKPQVNIASVVHDEMQAGVDSKLQYEATVLWPNAGQVALFTLAAPLSALFLYFVPIDRAVVYPFNVLGYYQRKLQYKVVGAIKGVNLLETIMEAENELREIEDHLGALAFKVFTTKRNLVRFIAVVGATMAAYKTYQFVRSFLANDETEIPKDKIIVISQPIAPKVEVPKMEATVIKSIAGEDVNIVLPPVESQKPYQYPSAYVQDRVPYSSNIIKAMSSPVSNTTYDALVTKLSRNSFLIIIGGGRFNGFFLKDQIFVTVAHGFPPSFLSSTDEVVTVTLTNQFVTTSPIAVERNQVYKGDGDIVYIYLNPVNRHTDLSKYCRNFSEGSVALPQVVALELTEQNGIIRQKERVLHNGTPVELHINVPSYDCALLTKGFEFDGEMLKGSSGCPVILVAGVSASIIGIQSASMAGKSLMQKLEPLSYQDIRSKFDVDRALGAQVDQYISVLTHPNPGKWSVAQHLEGGCIDYVGTLVEHHPVRNKTSFRRSIFYDYVTKGGYFYHEDRLICSDKYCIPELSPFSILDEEGNRRWVSQKLIGVAQAATPDVLEAPQTLIDVCHADYMSAIQRLKLSPIEGPVSLHDVLNGAQGVKSVNTKASAGFFHRGLVKDLLDGEPGKWRFKSHIQKEYEELEMQVASGRVPAQLVTVNVKDEIVKESKLASLRVFMCFPALFTIMSKRYLTPLLNIVIAHPDTFEVALGINALGKSWNQMITVLLQYKYILDGDYKKYDKKQMRRILLSFKRFIFTLAEMSKYPIWATHMCMYLIDMMIYHTIVLGEDLFALMRSLPSGCLLTIFFNCYVNSIYFRMAWFSKFDENFRDYNALRTFGDDALNATNRIEFDMQFISKELAKYGVTFTAASKEESEKPFSTPEKITFLKRSFKRTTLSDGHDYYLCPLAEASIFKMLAFTDCAAEDEPLIMCANLLDAQKQYWFHGRDVFENITVFLKYVAHEAKVSGSIGLEGSTNPMRWCTYEEIESKYLSGTLQIQFL